MTRVTKRGIKFFSYAVALLAGAVLVVLGIQGSNSGKVTQEETADGPLGATVFADHTGDTTSGDVPWSGAGGHQGDDDDDDDGP